MVGNDDRVIIEVTQADARTRQADEANHNSRQAKHTKSVGTRGHSDPCRASDETCLVGRSWQG